MKKKLALIAIAATISLSLIACGKGTATDVQTNGESSDNSQISENAVSDNENKEDIAVNPYIEEMGIELTDIVVQNLPYQAAFVTADGKELADCPAYSIDNANGCDIDVRNITVTDSEDEGYVNMVIETTALADTVINYDLNKDKDKSGFNLSLSYPGYWIADYYTGIIAPEEDTNGDGSFELSYDVVWKDATYTITVNEEIKWDSSWDKWSLADENGLSSTIYHSGFTKTITLHMPKDYDGLVLYTVSHGKNPISLASDAEDNSSKDKIYLLCDEYKNGITTKPEEFIVIRVNDIIDSYKIPEDTED